MAVGFQTQQLALTFDRLMAEAAAREKDSV
jgi:hypothetical protein